MHYSISYFIECLAFALLPSFLCHAAKGYPESNVPCIDSIKRTSTLRQCLLPPALASTSSSCDASSCNMCQCKFPKNMTLTLTRRTGTFRVRLVSKSTIQPKAQTHFSYTCLSSSHSHGRYMFFLRHVFSGMRRLSIAMLILTTSREDEWMVRTQNIDLCIPEAVCSLSSPSETR